MSEVIGGYAPGDYYCTCLDCGCRFIGDKRATQCKKCAEKQAIETCQDMLDVLNVSGSTYLYKHNGGDKKLKNIIIVLQENADLRTRLEAAQDWINKSADILEATEQDNKNLEADLLSVRQEKNRAWREVQDHARGWSTEIDKRKLAIEERDELRRQVETLTKAKENALDYCHRYKKACDDLVELKEKQYAQIDELESQNQAMRQALEKITHVGCDSPAWRVAQQALTATAGTNYVQRLEQAAQDVVLEWSGYGVPGSDEAIAAVVNNLAAVLAERESDNSGR